MDEEKVITSEGEEISKEESERRVKKAEVILDKFTNDPIGEELPEVSTDYNTKLMVARIISLERRLLATENHLKTIYKTLININKGEKNEQN